ncbi:hypothetical protein KY359_02335, partial [Candidatus Woesearchaeota archaeon]|nr:hypothetical protein [Candidatus Woesearchaeota archaeon]
TREERAASGKKKPYKGAQKKGDSGKKKKRRKDEPRSLPEICEDITETLGIPLDPRSATLKSVMAALTDDLKANLEHRLMDVEEIGSAMIEDMTVGGGVLQVFGDNLQKFAFDAFTRKYEVIAKCTRPGCEGQLKHILPFDADRYIQEIPFKEAWYAPAEPGHPLVVPDGINPKGYGRDCSICGSPLDATSAMNIMYLSGEGPVYAVILRVKSAGRYVDKLVDLLFYDPDDPDMKRRSISDKYAFTIVLNHPNGYSNSEFKRVFRERFGTSLKPKHGFGIGDMACYAVYDLLAAHFGNPKKPRVVRNLQDDIKNPQPRVGPNGIELYKRLQFNLHYDKMVFEGQIKTLDIWLNEIGRTSAMSHWTWEETERELRDKMYMRKPEALVVKDIIKRIFPAYEAEGR